MDLSKFNEKFNKLEGNIYTVEEEVALTNGIYDRALAHGNINKKSLNIYTGSKLTGDKVTNYFLSTPSETPWKYTIKIFANVGKVYITYETTGDQVEAEDINNIQNAIVDTQNNLNSVNDNLNTEAERAKKAENEIDNLIATNKPVWDDKYTQAETDNKISQVVSNLDWKEAVNTYNDIAIIYLNPQDGWTVNVKDADITYRYDGNAWIPISANSIPLATASVDGKMSKQDKIDHDDMNSKKHIHDNKSIIDTITQALFDTWNTAYTHISDAVKHITSDERTLWNTVNDKVDKITGKQLSTEDYTTEEKTKLANISTIITLTESEYAAITTPDANTLYLIKV